ncbi:MAG: hypothetical protein CMO12_03375 [Thaumarchaeota archaeon]|nr:hypothetical protein [Nitrososphaerota archaeon]
MESYVLMTIDTTDRLGYPSEILWEKEAIRVHEIEGSWDAFAYFAGSFEDIKKFGERVRRTKGVQAAETYVVTNSIPERQNYKEPLALITGSAQPRYRSNDQPIHIPSLLDRLSKFFGMSKVSAVLGGLDLIGEICSVNLTEWHIARREIMKGLPSYVSIETHQVISLDYSEGSESVNPNSGRKKRAVKR